MAKRLITSTKIETESKILQQRKAQGHVASQVNSTQSLEKS